jgi:hypothetical protein
MRPSKPFSFRQVINNVVASAQQRETGMGMLPLKQHLPTTQLASLVTTTMMSLLLAARIH